MRKNISLAAVSPKIHLGDCFKNQKEIETHILKLEALGADIVVFPELCVSGSTCQDMFFFPELIQASSKALVNLIALPKNMLCLVGLPFLIGEDLYSTAAVIKNNKLIGLVPKLGFDINQSQARWFNNSLEASIDSIEFENTTVPIVRDGLFEVDEFLVSINFYTQINKRKEGKLLNGNLELLNLYMDSSPEFIGRHDKVGSNLSKNSEGAFLAYANSGYGESTTDHVFSGYNCIYADGKLCEESPKYMMEGTHSLYSFCLSPSSKKQYMKSKNLDKPVDVSQISHKNRPGYFDSGYKSASPFLLKTSSTDDQIKEIFNMQSIALNTRLKKASIERLVIGVSGGLDSTLALLSTVNAFSKADISPSNIFAISMPGFGTSAKTRLNAHKLATLLGCTFVEIDIIPAVSQHLKDINHPLDAFDITFENSQARERTQILMDYANRIKGLVIGTGNMSEVALGFSTYNGDHMSMYAINIGIPKTVVIEMVRQGGKLLFDRKVDAVCQDILSTPISPELLPSEGENPSQKTEDILGPYILHDFFLYHFMVFKLSFNELKIIALDVFKNIFNEEIIDFTLKTFFSRFFTQQFKRSCMPDGPQIFSFSLSPRVGWLMPSDMAPTPFIS